MTLSSLSDDQLRQQIRVRLTQARLPVVSGTYKTHRGTGRPCIVCRREIEPTDLECEVEGAGIVLISHDSCHVLWREESVKLGDSRTMAMCRYCGRPIKEGERRYREPAGDVHVDCRDNAQRRGLG